MVLLSVVVPVKEERENIRPLLAELRDALNPTCDWEVIFVDDGSTDGTHRVIENEAEIDGRIKLVRLRKNFGQSAALQAGFDHAEGDVIATMDGDLQNDPADIPRMLDLLTDGYDAILGERVNRKDKYFLRKVPSWAANWLIRKVLGVKFKDFGCTLRVFRRDAIDGLKLFGEMHRFFNALLVQNGAAIRQIPVNHRPRTAGASKYNLTLAVRVVLDLCTVKFLATFQARPMHLFGGIGLALMLLGFVALGSTLAMKLTGGPFITGNPLLVLGAMLELMGLQFLSLGLFGEVMSRQHFGRTGERPYRVREAKTPRPIRIAA